MHFGATVWLSLLWYAGDDLVGVVVFSRKLFVILARIAEDLYPPSLRVGSIVSLEPNRAPTVATTPSNTQLACDGTAYSAGSSYNPCESVQDTTRLRFSGRP